MEGGGRGRLGNAAFDRLRYGVLGRRDWEGDREKYSAERGPGGCFRGVGCVLGEGGRRTETETKMKDSDERLG